MTSIPEKQEGGGMSQGSTSPCSQELFTIPELASSSQHLTCVEDIAVSPKSRPLESTPKSLSQVSQNANAIIDHQLEATSPVIAQIPSKSAELLGTKLQSSVRSVHETSDPKTGNDESSCMPRILGNVGNDAALTQNHVGGSIRNGDEARKLSVAGNENVETSNQVQKPSNVLLQTGSSESPTGDTVKPRSVVIEMATPAHMSSFSFADPISPNPKSKNRTETLPRLAVLDLPLQGITPPSQDIDAPHQTQLERIQHSPHLAVGAIRSITDQDLSSEETDQHPKICHSANTSDQEPSSTSETSMGEVAGLNVSSSPMDDSLDDEVTFIVSVPRRRKKKKRNELSSDKPAGELAGKTKPFAPCPISAPCPTPRHPIANATKCLPLPQTLAGRSPTTSLSPIVAKQHAAPPASRDSSISLAPVRAVSHTTAQISKASQEAHVSGGVTSSCEVPEVNPEKSVPVTARKLGGSDETPEALPLKRKIGDADGQENEPLIKRSKLRNEQGQGRSAAQPTNHGQREASRSSIGCPSTSATSSIVGSQIPTNLNAQQHGAGDPLPHTNLNVRDRTAGFEAPRPASSVVTRIPIHSDLRDVRRKPSLYLIPSWPSPPVSSSTPDGQHIIPSTTRTSTASTAANTPQVTQTTKSPSLAPDGIPVSQHAQGKASSNSNSSSMSSQISSQIRAGSPAQPYVMQRSIDNYNRAAQPFAAQTVYTSSPYSPAQPILSMGQRMAQGNLAAHSQQFPLTPQEYARSFNSQYLLANQQRTSHLQQKGGTSTLPQTQRAESLVDNASAQDASQAEEQSQMSPSPNLLVDIAQTCQAIFPFARIAERHNQPVKKVFDAFSAVIQIPLLECAADRRRNAKLGTARLKKFREASKAVSEKHEKERKAEKQGAKMRNELAEPPAKKAKPGRPPKSASGKGLLEKALANSQKNASGSK